MRIVLIAAACVALGACSACETGAGPAGGKSEDKVAVVAWNVQALFDGKDDGSEYAEYQAAAGWTDAKYRDRLKRVGEAVGQAAEGGPDVLVLIEIENAAVAEDLASGPLAAYGYRWCARARNPGSALGLCLFSRLPIAKTTTHNVSADGEASPRPILEARIDAHGTPLTVIACHWKSKLGGEEATEAQRRASASLVARRLAQLSAEDPSLDVVVVGDLNENVDEFDRRGGTYATALLPDTEAAAALAASSSSTAGAAGSGFGIQPPLVVSGRKPPKACLVMGGAAVYSPWPFSSWKGSYAYRKVWETIDHTLMNAALFDGKGWEYASFRVADGAPLTDEAGFPASYNPRTGSGTSDHLPVAVELRRAP